MKNRSQIVISIAHFLRNRPKLLRDGNHFNATSNERLSLAHIRFSMHYTIVLDSMLVIDSLRALFSPPLYNTTAFDLFQRSEASACNYIAEH